MASALSGEWPINLWQEGFKTLGASYSLPSENM